MKTLRIALAMALLACFAGPARALSPDEMLANPKLEARAEALGRELRCLVCQNQSINDSDADLAHDLRVLLRQRLLAGDSDAQAKQYLVARYGDYVLLKPPFDPETYALWLGPALLLLIAIGFAWLFLRGNREGKEAAPLSSGEKSRLSRLIGDDTP